MLKILGDVWFVTNRESKYILGKGKVTSAGY